MKRWISFELNTNQNSNTSTRNATTTTTKNVGDIKNGTAEQPEPRAKKQANVNLMPYNFEHKTAPKTIDDVAVNKKKIEAVKEWLTQYVLDNNNGCYPLLVISGPTGCGKTVTVTTLCKMMKIDICEWINPMGSDYDPEIGWLGQTAKFVDFIRESKYPSLFSGTSQKKIVLVEDFPNNFMRNNQEFHEILGQLVHARVPIIFICTETNESRTNLFQILFPENIRQLHSIHTISFNATAVTLLKTVLHRIQSILAESSPNNIQIPSAAILEAIATSAMGDIRCAVNNYHMACVNGGAVPLSENTNTRKKRKRKGADKQQQQIMAVSSTSLRDNSLGTFHLLGRILNPKRKLIYANGDSSSASTATWRIDSDVHAIVDELATFPHMGIGLLQHNYLKYFGLFSEAVKAATVFSEAQSLFPKSIHTDNGELIEVALTYCVLGLMIYNEHKVAKWNQISAPKRPNTDANVINYTEQYYYDVCFSGKSTKGRFSLDDFR